MDSVLPTPEEQKRQEKLMRRIRVAEDVDPEAIPRAPRQQQKKIIKETMGDGSPRSPEMW